MADATDANVINKIKEVFLSSKKKPEKNENATEIDSTPRKTPKMTEIGIHDEYYNMRHLKRGKAIIFNHFKFDTGSSTREGTYEDVKVLKSVLASLQFEVQVYTDLKYGAIQEIIKELSQEDHSDNDCLLITVLSHGDPGKVYARDYSYDIQKLWMPFAGDKCPTLAGKPKLFFIQACRGEGMDDGVTIKNRSMIETDGRPMESYYKIPAMADFLIMYATFEGHYAWRSGSSGSWMIQSMCKAIKNHSKEKDLMTILTIANRMIATDFQSYTTIPSMDQKKQIGTIVSTCTRQLFFKDTKGVADEADAKEFKVKDFENDMHVDNKDKEGDESEPIS